MEAPVNYDATKYYNFLINIANQANLRGTKNLAPLQLNSLFLFVSPYDLERFTFEGLDLDLRTDEKGHIYINDTLFKTIEIKPGVRILGIVVRK
ncbi:MAG: hypothetical protein AB1420_07060 [Bacillota bacterium]